MQIRVYDKNLKLVGELDEFRSVIWRMSYSTEAAAGDVKILADVTENNKKLLKQGHILVKRKADPDLEDETGRWFRAAQIRYVHKETAIDGSELMEAQAMGLKSMLGRRIIREKIEATATEIEIINRIFDENIGLGAEEKRRMPIKKLVQPEDNGEPQEYANDDYAGVEKEIAALCASAGIGYDVLVEERKRQYGFWLYRGTDRTKGNKEGNRQVIISRDYDNVTDLEYTQTDEKAKNVIYLTGAKDENDRIPIVELGDAEGMERIETYKNGSSNSRKFEDKNGEQVEFTEKQYREILEKAAREELEELKEKTELKNELNPEGRYQFERDFSLGDKVTCLDKKWGIHEDASVTEAKISMEDGIIETSITLGDTIPNRIGG